MSLFACEDFHRSWTLVKSVQRCCGVYFLRTWNMP